MNELLPAYQLSTGPKPIGSVIWLHGLGANGFDFVPIAEELNLPFDLRFVFPHAPQQAVTINGGAVMPAWYDIRSLDFGQEDAEGIRGAARRIEAWIAQEEEEHPETGVVVAGFSQGGAIALHAALRYGHRLAGVIALSTYLPLADTLEKEAAKENAGLPIFMGHGLQDPIVPHGLGDASRALLEQRGYPVEWRSYAMAHSVCAEEIADLRRFFGAIFAGRQDSSSGQFLM